MRRVQAWREEHPGYWRKKDALQDSLNVQGLENKGENNNKMPLESQEPLPLQDSLNPQHPLIVGTLAMLTGHTLQDDIASTSASIIQSGLDILSEQPNAKGGKHAHQTDHPP